MIKGPLTHPLILEALAAAGHGSKVLLADGNYPLSTATAPTAARVHLNLTPCGLSVTDVLSVLVQAVAVESAQVMSPEGGPEPVIFDDFRRALVGAPVSPLPRATFYDACRAGDLALAIACGDRRHYANLLLTIGVLPEQSGS